MDRSRNLNDAVAHAKNIRMVQKSVARSAWPTPTESLRTGGDVVQAMFAGDDKNRPTYAEATAAWATPTVHGNSNRAGCSAKAGDGLSTQVQTSCWATPAARDYRHPNSQESQGRRKKGREKSGEQLPNQGAHVVWSTPRATDGMKGGPNQTFGSGGQPLPAQAAQAHLTTGMMPNSSSATTEKHAACPPLNPEFVLWLMGFPSGWLKSLGRGTP